MLNIHLQNLIAYAIIGFIFFRLSLKVYKSSLGPLLAHFYLKQGKVGLAMRIRSFCFKKKVCCDSPSD